MFVSVFVVWVGADGRRLGGARPPNARARAPARADRPETDRRPPNALNPPAPPARPRLQECKRLLRLMGVPVLEAPGEAEAQCAQLSKEGAVYGVSTEDMDALTFGTARLVRNLMAPASQVCVSLRVLGRREVGVSGFIRGLLIVD